VVDFWNELFLFVSQNATPHLGALAFRAPSTRIHTGPVNPAEPPAAEPSRKIKRKVCMLGTFAVGKTSLIRRYVRGVFDEKYLTTMGAKVDKKNVRVADVGVDLLLWDLNGEDRFQALSMEYARGAAGYLLVIDRTRPATLEAAHALQQKVLHAVGPLPFIVLVNKSDLPGHWDRQPGDLDALRAGGWVFVETSARTGTGVDEAFMSLASRLID